MVKRESPIGFRATESDKRTLKWLTRKLGIGVSQIIRLSLRRLYEIEKGR